MNWPTVVLNNVEATRANRETVRVSGKGYVVGCVVGEDRQMRGWLVAVGSSNVVIGPETIRVQLAQQGVHCPTGGIATC